MSTKLLIVEFVTGGGMAGSVLPDGLMHEGDLMVKSMLSDLASLPDVRVSVLRDGRLSPLPEAVETLWVTKTLDEILPRALRACDVVWLVAPETADALRHLTDKIAGVPHLGCTTDAVRIASSKWRTAKYLDKAQVPVVPTHRAADFSREKLDKSADSWVIKPDDGAGCVDTRRWTHVPPQVASHEVIQPWLAGEAMSLSLLCRRDEVQVLSVNRQIMRQDGAGRLSLAALEVNVCPVDKYQNLAQSVYAAVPGLLGAVGVDFVHTQNGAVVLEINPRMTTSFCVLQEAAGINLAAELLAEAGFAIKPLPGVGRGMVRMELT